MTTGQRGEAVPYCCCGSVQGADGRRRATGGPGREGGVPNMYLFCFCRRDETKGQDTTETDLPSDVRRRNQDARPLRALMRGMGHGKMRDTERPTRAREARGRRRGFRQSCPTTIYLTPGQAMNLFRTTAHRDVCQSQGVQKDKDLVRQTVLARDTSTSMMDDGRCG